MENLLNPPVSMKVKLSLNIHGNNKNARGTKIKTGFNYFVGTMIDLACKYPFSRRKKKEQASYRRTINRALNHFSSIH